MPILSEKTINSHTPCITGPAGGSLPIWKPLHLHKVVKGGGREKRTLGKKNRSQLPFKPRTGSLSSPPVSFQASLAL